MRIKGFPAWNRQTLPSGSPFASIQWKGTDVCMDIHCSCGQHSHIDEEFVYHVQCPSCGKVYMCNSHIELIPLTEEEAQEVEKHGIIQYPKI